MPRKRAATNKRLLRADAYEKLLAAIILGELEAGSSVDERELVRRYGLGQAAVRDALLRLSLEGLVDRRPRIGTRIADLGLRELQDIFEARVLLESYAAGLVATRASAGDIAAIRVAYAGHDEAVDRRDIRKLLDIDRAFHRALGAACKNAEIERAIVRLHNNACRFWLFGIQRASADEIKAQGRAHLEILTAIENKDMAEIEHRVRKVIGYNPDSHFLLYEPRLSTAMRFTAAAVG